MGYNTLKEEGRMNRTSRLVPTTMIALLVTVSFLSSVTVPVEAAKYVKESVPDFGQHSTNWCWVAALANSLYWFKHFGGYPNLYPDAWDNQIIPEPGCPNPAGGYRRLLDEIAKAAGKKFSECVGQNEYLNAIQKLLDSFDYSNSSGMLVLHVVEGPGFDDLTIVGPGGPYETPSVPPVASLVKVTIRNPTFKDYKDQLKRCQDVLLWLGDGNPNTIDHIVTGVSYDDTPGAEKIDVADPWTHNAGHDDPGPGAPDHNNSPDHSQNPYEEYPVINKNPLTIDYPGDTKDSVLKLIFISPPEKRCVGGDMQLFRSIGVPSDKLPPLIPWISLASLMIVTVASVAYIKHRKRQQA